MDPVALLKMFYPVDSLSYRILLEHSRLVMEEAVAVVKNHPELMADMQFVREAAMLHDIGIFKTDAPDLGCFGSLPYICHGYLGADLLRGVGLPRHALVCERHTGTGLALQEIIARNLPVPHREMVPVSIEEQIICYADKFYSKSNPGVRKSPERVRKGLQKWGERSVKQFDSWHELFAPKIY